MEFLTKTKDFASLHHLMRGHIDSTCYDEIYAAFQSFQAKNLIEAATEFLEIWQHVQNMQQDLLSKPIPLDQFDAFFKKNEVIGSQIKDLQELAISLLQDAAVTFFLMENEPYKPKEVLRLRPSWPKTSSELIIDGEPNLAYTAVAAVFEVQYPFDVLLQNVKTTREMAEMLSYTCLIQMRLFGSADTSNLHCIIGNSTSLSTKDRDTILKGALAFSKQWRGEENLWVKHYLAELAGSR